MVKKYYEILEVSETATPEEIKKNYRKLALKWHPDKWSTKSSEEKETANKKIQEINKAYEILGNEDLKRRYDNGEEFTSDFGGYDYEGEIKEEFRRREEELRKARVDVIDIELEILKLEMKSLDRSSTINEIRLSFYLTFPRVFEENLDSKLWEGYQDWMEKVVKMEITIPKGKDRSEELKNFKEEMTKAIKEAETVLEAKEKDKQNKKKERANSKVGREKNSAVEEIERLITEKGLKTQDLGEYSNYQEQIDNLNKIWEVRELRDKVMVFVNNWKGKVNRDNKKKGGDEKRGKGDNRPTKGQDKSQEQGKEDQFPNKSDDNNQKDKVNYGNLTREELINTINQKDLENGSLKEIITALERKIEELEEEIKELRGETQTPEIKHEISKRETQLKEAENSLEKINIINKRPEQNSNKTGNKFPTGWIIGGGTVLVVGIIGILIINKQKKKKSY